MSAIGIIGGVGPSAGTDLATKIFSHTKASKDQEHIDLYLVSCPSIIPDRTGYLLNGGENPVPGIQKCMDKLALCGATAVGLCCNTAHSPKIVGMVKVPEGVKFINMIDSTCKTINEKFPCAKIGIIATLGTLKTGIYDQYFKSYPNLELVKASEELQEKVHDAIYNKTYGIKASSSISKEADTAVKEAVSYLKNAGCKAVILGCTELPLVFPKQTEFEGITLIDPTDILAIELIKATEPEKLK